MKRFSIAGASVIGIAVLIMIFTLRSEVSQNLVDGVKGIKESVFYEEEHEEYGIDIDDLYLCTDVIKPNENLGEILGRNGIPFQVIQEIADKSEDVFDVRKIRAGKSYCIMRTSDSLQQVQYFIYEQDPVNYVVYEMGDSISVYSGKKKVTEKTRMASGVINSSLWKTLTDNDLDPELAVRLSEILAWSVDFYRIQEGDQFKVIFNERFSEGEKVGVGDVDGVWFEHAGRGFYAIHYAQDDSTSDYFDGDGNSLRKAFLKAPLQFRRVSSRFNRRRFHPILKRARPHLGTDYAAATGTPVWAIGDGVVTKAKYSRGGGNHVEIRHNGTYTTRYLHFSKFGEGIKVGAHVQQGQTIGYVGSTGLATGPHLHFEMIKNGGHVDAMQEDLPPGDPVAAECMGSFQIVRDQMVEKLASVPMTGESLERSAEGAVSSQP